MSSVLLLGATGLVGRHCLDLLAADRAFERVVVLVRRRFAEALAPRVEAHIVDFAHLDERPELFGVDQLICALGTTIKTVEGSRAPRCRLGEPSVPSAIAPLGGEHDQIQRVRSFDLEPARATIACFVRRRQRFGHDAFVTGGNRSVVERAGFFLGRRHQSWNGQIRRNGPR